MNGDHYKECPLSVENTRYLGLSAECECVEIERDVRAEWIDDGAPEDWAGWRVLD